MGERLFGPLFGYEAVRLARGPWLLRLRGYAALVLGLTVTAAYAAWADSRGLDPLGHLFSAARADARDRAQFAAGLVTALFIAQYGVLLAVTPAYLAGLFVAERKAGTLDLLLTTPLSDREIVAGKLAPRVAVLWSVALTALPVGLGMLAWGGFEPVGVAAATAATAAAVALLSAMVARVSVVAATWGEAAAMGWVTAAVFFVVGGPVVACVFNVADVGAYSLPFSVALALGALVTAGDSGGAVRRRLPDHPPRPPEPSEWAEPPPAAAPRTHPWVRLPPVGDDALWWLRTAYAGRHGAEELVFAAGVFATFGYVLAGFLVVAAPPDQRHGLLAGCFAVAVAVLAVVPGFSAVDAVCGERERDTLTGLLTLPVERTDILRTVAEAAAARTRLLFVPLALLLGLAAACGAYHPLAAIAAAGAVAAPVLLATALAVWITVTVPTTVQGRLWLAVALVFAPGLGHLMGETGPMLLGVRPPAGLAAGLNPLRAAGAMGGPLDDDHLARTPGVALGLAVQLALAAGLWADAVRRFDRRPVPRPAPAGGG